MTDHKRLRSDVQKMLAAAKTANGGRIPHGQRRAAAHLLGLSPRQISRDAQSAGEEAKSATKRSRYDLTESAREMLILTNGNRRLAYDRLPKSEKPGSYSAFARAVKRDQAPDSAFDITGGDAARWQGELFLLRTYERPYQVLVADEKVVSTQALHPETGAVIQPHAIHFRDAYTGGVVGASVRPDPITAQDFIEALVDALRLDSDLGPFGGIPEAFQWDQATCHTADLVTLALCELHVPVNITDGYHPYQNGIVESFHAFVESHYAKGTPFYTHGPVRLGGEPYRPHSSAMPTWAEFAQDYRAFLCWYNRDWRHRGRDNKTAVELWEQAERKPAPVDPETLRWLNFETKTVTVTKYGVQLRDKHYTNGRLPKVGSRVRIRAASSDRRQVEVFDLNDNFICTAVLHKDVSSDEGLAIVADRTAQRIPDRKRRRKVLTQVEVDTRERRRSAEPSLPDDLNVRARRAKALAESRPPTGLNKPLPPRTRPGHDEEPTADGAVDA